MKSIAKLFASVALASWLAACSQPANEAGEGEAETALPVESAQEFAARAHAEYADLWPEQSAADWVRSTYITEDTALLAAKAGERYSEWHSNMVRQAMQYDAQDLDPATRRTIDRLRLITAQPAPDDADKRAELSRIATDLEGMYGAGKYCKGETDCRSLTELTDVMAQSRDYDELLDIWRGWRTVAPPMRDKYGRFVEIANEGANELGFSDVGELWRAGYDMSATEFDAETTRLWQQVEPLYNALHCHVRAKLGEFYGEDKVPQGQPIPAHLLGNMWAQAWGFIYDIMEPYPGTAELDVDSTLKAKNYSPQEMVRSAESFYVSLGFDRLPDTFWRRSMFEKPADREVVCHASAWSLDGADDLRIKMCIKQTYDELRVIYHELGHNYYQWAYKDQPALFWDGAHDGFHEAIGDVVTLSMTPDYLAEVGLIKPIEQSEQAVINRQMMQALDKIAFLPFGKLIDEWRWGVFSGAIAPDNYNQAWWDLRTRYQGVAAPIERSEADFDPGAKNHIPANVPYSRYFLAHILQFQMQRALCDIAGHEGPLHECSVYGSNQAGKKFWAMLEAGASEPWQDTLEKLTGTREMDAGALIEYFGPLMAYLEEQNDGRSCGW